MTHPRGSEPDAAGSRGAPPRQMVSRPTQAAQACRRALDHRPAGLVTDLDGTISPIAPTPTEATVTAGCREALSALSGRLDLLAVLTGRAPEEARALVSVDGVEYLGVHGLVRWTTQGLQVHPDARPFLQIVAGVAADLRERLRLPGVIVEEKGPAVAVHYRQSGQPSDVRRMLIAELGKLAEAGGLELVEGRMVVELRPPAPFGKGWCIQDLVRDRRLASLVYLGDDRTDIDAFQALRSWRQGAAARRGVALAVRSPEMPPDLAAGADYVLDGVPAVESLLQELAGLAGS